MPQLSPVYSHQIHKGLCCDVATYPTQLSSASAAELSSINSLIPLILLLSNKFLVPHTTHIQCLKTTPSLIPSCKVTVDKQWHWFFFVPPAEPDYNNLKYLWVHLCYFFVFITIIYKIFVIEQWCFHDYASAIMCDALQIPYCQTQQFNENKIFLQNSFLCSLYDTITFQEKNMNQPIEITNENVINLQKICEHHIIN